MVQMPIATIHPNPGFSPVVRYEIRYEIMEDLCATIFVHLLAMFSRSLDQQFARFRPIFPDEMMNQDHRQLNVQFLWIKSAMS